MFRDRRVRLKRAVLLAALVFAVAIVPTMAFGASAGTQDSGAPSAAPTGIIQGGFINDPISEIVRTKAREAGVPAAALYSNEYVQLPTVDGTPIFKNTSGVNCFDGSFTNDTANSVLEPMVYFEFHDGQNQLIGSTAVSANCYVLPVSWRGWWNCVVPDLPTPYFHTHWGVFAQQGGSEWPDQQWKNTGTYAQSVLADGSRKYDAVFNNLFGYPVSDVMVTGQEFRGSGFFDTISDEYTYRMLGTVVPAGGSLPVVAYGRRAATAAELPTILPGLSTPGNGFQIEAKPQSLLTAVGSVSGSPYGATLPISGVLTNYAGTAIAGTIVWLYSDTGEEVDATTTAGTGAYLAAVTPDIKTSYQAYYRGNATHASVWSSAVTIDPKVYLTRPYAPRRKAVGRYFTSYGYLKPWHTPGTKPVVIKFYRKNSAGVYKYHHSVYAKAYDYYGYTKYKAKVKFPHRGKWRIRAFHDDAGHYPTYSTYRYTTVY